MLVSTFLVSSPDMRLYNMADGSKIADNNINMGDVIKLAKYDPFWKHRGEAVQLYAQLESSLCGLLRVLSGMSWDAAVTVFYKITNTNARNAILEKLLHKKCGSIFNPFWNPLIKEIRLLDLKRNEIVHWLAAANVTVNNHQHVMMGITLIPPASLYDKQATPQQIASQDLIDFAFKCSEMSLLLNQFSMRIEPPDGKARDVPWLDIFQLPFVYPLPEGHPARRPKEPQIHPQSFPSSLLFLHQTPEGLSHWQLPT